MIKDMVGFIADRSLPNNDSGCIEWSLSVSRDGYGKTKMNGKDIHAHRASWIAHNGPIPPGLLVCHKCDNPACVNIDHLYLGTPQDNMNDKMARGRYRGGPAFWKFASRERVNGHLIIGSNHHNAKLTEEDVLKIKKLLSSTTNKVIGAMFGVSDVAVSRIRNGLAWKHVQMEAA